ncbi:MAG: hypothetical protein F4X84_02605 [Synechococcus sp. SB0662_bin_45]|nr:hypothetical protein [Synechococcus sp. SB0668_bin_13]MYE21279.1 hypothetical protein [Synechococcus sp. SB0662_bin_45]
MAGLLLEGSGNALLLAPLGGQGGLQPALTAQAPQGLGAKKHHKPLQEVRLFERLEQLHLQKALGHGAGLAVVQPPAIAVGENAPARPSHPAQFSNHGGRWRRLAALALAQIDLPCRCLEHHKALLLPPSQTAEHGPDQGMSGDVRLPGCEAGADAGDNGRQLQPDGLQLLIVQGLPRLGVLQFSLQEAAAE